MTHFESLKCTSVSVIGNVDLLNYLTKYMFVVSIFFIKHFSEVSSFLATAVRFVYVILRIEYKFLLALNWGLLFRSIYIFYYGKNNTKI